MATFVLFLTIGLKHRSLQIQRLEGFFNIGAGCRLQLSNRFGADLNKIINFFYRYRQEFQQPK